MHVNFSITSAPLQNKSVECYLNLNFHTRQLFTGTCKTSALNCLDKYNDGGNKKNKLTVASSGELDLLLKAM